MVEQATPRVVNQLNAITSLLVSMRTWRTGSINQSTKRCSTCSEQPWTYFEVHVFIFERHGNKHKHIPSITPQGYFRPRTFLPATVSIVLLPTTAKGSRSCGCKASKQSNNYCISRNRRLNFAHYTICRTQHEHIHHITVGMTEFTTRQIVLCHNWTNIFTV